MIGSTGGQGDLASHDPRWARYSRQMLVEGIGVDGQRRLGESSVLLVGCGALGSVAADMLVRGGVGRLRICDRDYIERNNLQRQVLFDEDDIAADLPKAEAAVRKLRRINSEVHAEAVVADLTHRNVAELADGVSLIVDGTDNFETRYLVNDFAVSTGRAWIYGAVIGATGLCMSILPGRTPCLRCVFEQPPPAELSPTCETVGVLAPAAHMVASLQVLEAIKILVGKPEQIYRGLVQLDAWSGRMTTMNMDRARESDCPCCGRREFPYLEGRFASSTATLCGRDAVQITPAERAAPDLASIASRLAPVAIGPVRSNKFMVRAEVEGLEITVFADGRIIIKGTSDPGLARSIQARFLGA